MTPMVERLAELRKHLDHLASIRPRVRSRHELARLPGFRNILIHEYVGLDYDLVLRALDHLGPIERFLQTVAARLSPPGQ